LNKLRTTAESKKTEYVSAIGTLQSKLKSTQNSLTSVQGDLTSATSSIAGTVSQGISSSLTLQKENVKKQLSETEKLIAKYEEEHNSQKVQDLYTQKSELQKQQEELNDNNNSTYAKAFSSGLSRGLNYIKIGEKDKNIADYDAIWTKLENAKAKTQG
jgi:chromosome segregation ATPase